nr:hypothetical protein [Rhodoferax sp.]
MSIFALLVLAIAILPAFGLATWVWLAIASETDDVRSFVGFEGMHFEK